MELLLATNPCHLQSLAAVVSLATDVPPSPTETSPVQMVPHCSVSAENLDNGQLSLSALPMPANQLFWAAMALDTRLLPFKCSSVTECDIGI